MRRNIKIKMMIGVLLALAAVLYGCGGGGSSSYGNSNDMTTSTVQAVACPASGTTDVAISGFAFNPASVTVPANTTVKWTNQDASTHTVTSTTVPAGGAFDAQINPGMSICLKFTTAGTYNYHCSIHPAMTGAVNVQ